MSVNVPEEMLAASIEELRKRCQYDLDWEPGMHTVQANRCLIAAALGWLREKIEALHVENKTTWQASRNRTIDEILGIFVAAKEDDPLVVYIMRHFDDVEYDERTRRHRAEAAVADYKEHLERNSPNPSSIPPSEMPKAVEELRWADGEPYAALHNQDIVEAFRRGKASR